MDQWDKEDCLNYFAYKAKYSGGRKGYGEFIRTMKVVSLFPKHLWKFCSL